MDGLGWDGISLNRLTTRSPYGDNKYPFGQERNVDLPIWSIKSDSWKNRRSIRTQWTCGQ